MERVESQTATEIGWLEDLDVKSSLGKTARCSGKDLTSRIRHEDRSFYQEHVGNDEAGRLAGARWGDEGKVLERILRTEAVVRRQDETTVTRVQEAPPLPTVHPAGVAVDF